jgi:hypothetical protein
MQASIVFSASVLYCDFRNQARFVSRAHISLSLIVQDILMQRVKPTIADSLKATLLGKKKGHETVRYFAPSFRQQILYLIFDLLLTIHLLM